MNVIEENDINAPEYLNEDFFRNALIQGLQETQSIQINRITLSKGSKGGDNYCSDIYRAVIQYTNSKQEIKEQSLIVKSLPILNVEGNTLESFNVFEKEVLAYCEILPKIDSLYSGQFMFAPKCFYFVTEPTKSIVMQDLRALDYVMGDREKGLDFEQSRLVLEKLGKYHAGSVILGKKDPEIMKNFNQGLFNDKIKSEKIFDTIFVDNFRQLINIAEKWSGYEIIVLKLKKICENFLDIASEHVKERPEQFNVLNHGDLWVNNFMTKYSKTYMEKPEDTVFVDLQIGFWSSPGIDLNYFFNTSLQLEVFKNKRDDLVDIYCESLLNSLKILNYPNIPSKEMIKNEIHCRELYGLLTGVGAFPIIAMDSKECTDNSLETISDPILAAKTKEIMFASKRVHEFYRFALKRLDDLEVFDQCL